MGYRPAQVPVVADGKLRRVGWVGKGAASNKTGWYVLYDEGDWQAGAWGDWRDGITETWCSREPRRMTAEARRALEVKMREAREQEARERAAARAQAEWRAWMRWCAGVPADEVDGHGYLTRKKIGGAGLRVAGGDLLVPLRDGDGVLANVQRISGEGVKRFERAAAVAGLMWVCGGPLPSAGGDVVICEGAATAATLRELSGWPSVAAMNAGNLEAVAVAVRARCPEARIIIAADDDRWEKDGTPRPVEKNAGMVKARAAAVAVRGLVAAPVFTDIGSRGTDWNDLWCEEGEMGARAKWATALALSGLDAQVAAMSEAEYAARKGALTAAYKAAGAGAAGPRALDLRRKEVTAAVRAVAEEEDGPSAVLARLAGEPELWHDQFGQAFATFDLNGRRVNARVEGRIFRDWLRMSYEDETGSAVPPGREMVTACVEQAAARARARGRGMESFVRLGWTAEGVRYLDLGTPEWNAVEVDAAGWRVVEAPAVKFTRTDAKGALPLPVRTEAGIAPLWHLLNVAEEDRCLIAGWLLCTLLGNAPAFGLNLHGGQGTAKTTATRVLRRIVDPTPSLTQTLSEKKVDEFLLTCREQWVPCIENLSWLSDDMQDVLCMLTTGAGSRSRMLYTDGDIFTYSVRRPWILNGINNVCSRNDLSERAVPVGLLPLDPQRRRTEEEIEEEFLLAWPGILAALLDAVSMACDAGYRAQAQAMLAREGLSHRMADALLWITAGEEGLGFPAGSFIRRLTTMQEDAGRDALADHPVVLALQKLLAEQRDKMSEWTYRADVEWTGTNEDLLTAMEDFCPGKRPPKGCEDGRKLGMWLKREAGRLRTSFGLEVEEARVEWIGGGPKRVRTVKDLNRTNRTKP